jgi:hypothetical protein
MFFSVIKEIMNRDDGSSRSKAVLVVIVLVVGLLGSFFFNRYIDKLVDARVSEIVSQIEKESAERALEHIIHEQEVTEDILTEVLDRTTEIQDQSKRIQEKVIEDVKIIERIEAPVDVVDTLVAERIIDGMWEAYCNPVGNDRTCTSR